MRHATSFDKTSKHFTGALIAFGVATLAFEETGRAQAAEQEDAEAEAADQSQSRLSYDADFFSAFNPTTALDMIERLPGFVIDTGDDVRGFGGSAGNILIDGERPTAKGRLLSDILGRIPAQDVVRIELFRGRAPGIDMRGQPVVANVIVRRTGTSGFVEAEFRLSEDGVITPNGEISVGGEFLGFDYRIGAQRAAIRDLDDQPETLSAPDGTVLEFRPEEGAIVLNPWTFTGSLERDFGGWLTRLNGGLSFATRTFDELSPVFDPATDTLIRTNKTSTVDDRAGFEIGGDIDKALSDTLSWKLIALQSLDERDFDGVFTEDLADGQSTRIRQTITDRSGESILRSIFTLTPGGGSTYEVGIEGAYNFLDSNVELSIDTGDGPVPQDLPISDTTVEEYRLEPFINGSWQLGQKLTVEAGLTAEYSLIEQSGDAEESRTFLFLKPTVSLAYDVSDRDQIRFNFLREVAQLDFTDFVTSTELDDQVTDFGNPQLAPQRDWIARLEWERRFTEDDNLTLLFEYRRLEDVQELIPINGLFDAPGNIGGGTAWRARLDWQFSLDRLGLPNALLEGWYQYAHSSVTDPVTGEKRGITFASPSSLLVREHELHLEFRQDFPDQQWAWGAEYAFFDDHEDFRINERRHTDTGPFFLSVFAETTRFLDLNIRLEAFVREPRSLRERVFFAGTRASGVVTAVEVRDRKFEKQALLSIRKTF